MPMVDTIEVFSIFTISFLRTPPMANSYLITSDGGPINLHPFSSQMMDEFLSLKVLKRD